MSDSIFTKIIKREIPAEIIFENNHVAAFRDINPQAPVHLLVVPKQQIKDVTELSKELAGEIFSAINQLVDKFDLKKDGFRIVTNTGADAGQTVFHLHFHLLSGRKMGWPPG